MKKVLRKRTLQVATVTATDTYVNVEPEEDFLCACGSAAPARLIQPLHIKGRRLVELGGIEDGVSSRLRRPLCVSVLVRHRGGSVCSAVLTPGLILIDSEIPLSLDQLHPALL